MPETPPGRPGLPPWAAEVLREMSPYVLAVHVPLLLSAPAEVAVPVVRRLRGRRGVTLVPSLVGSADALAAVLAVRLARRRPGARLVRAVGAQPPREVLVPALLWALLAPALVAGDERAVVLRRRSPLWGLVVGSAPGVLVAATELAVLLVRLQRSRPAAG